MYLCLTCRKRAYHFLVMSSGWSCNDDISMLHSFIFRLGHPQEELDKCCPSEWATIPNWWSPSHPWDFLVGPEALPEWFTITQSKSAHCYQGKCVHVCSVGSLLQRQGHLEMLPLLSSMALRGMSKGLERALLHLMVVSWWKTCKCS